MGNTIDFILRMKETMSSGFAKVQTTAQSAFTTVDKKATQTQRALNMTGRSAVTLERYLKMLERKRSISIDDSAISNANRKIQQVESRLKSIRNLGRTDTGAMPKDGGNNIPLGMGKLTRYAAGLGIVAALSSGVGYSANAGLQGGAQKISFQTMAGDAKGGRLYNDVTKFAQDSIYGNELYKNAQIQMAFGNAAENVMPALKMLGDVAMGDKQRLESLNLAYSQVLAAGKLQGQDLLQFVNAGFNPLQKISELTGRSMAQLREDMSEGKITFDMVRKSFTAATSEGGKFYKMTDRIAATPYGKVEAMKGQVQGLALQFGGMLAPYIGQAVDNLATPFINWVSKDVLPKLDIVLAGAKDFMPIMKGIAVTANKLLTPLVSVLLSSDFKGLATEVLDLTHSLAKDLIPAVELTASAMQLLVKILKPIIGVVNVGAKAVSNEGDAAGFVAAFEKQGLIKPKYGYGLPAAEARKLGKVLIPQANPTDITGGKGFPFINPILKPVAPAAPAAGGGFGGSNPAGISDSDFKSLQGKSEDKIHGGGTNITYIFHDAIVKGTTINATGSAEAFEDFDDKVAESVLRIMGGNGKED